MFIFEEMLPQFTTTQVKNGIDSNDFMLDLSEYAKKKDSASKTELEALVNVVANKLDATPQHKHHIEDVKQLQSQLDSKYDKSEKYSCSVILSDTEKIPYLEAPKVEILEIAKDKDSEGYKLYVDDSNGDLMIVLNEVLIATYSKASAKWNFNGLSVEVDLTDINTEITNLKSDLNTHKNNINSVVNDLYTIAVPASQKAIALEESFNNYVAKTDVIIKNHYEALLILCQKHGMVDGNTADGDKVTPE